jgi:hypothetical protein
VRTLCVIGRLGIETLRRFDLAGRKLPSGLMIKQIYGDPPNP